MEYDDVRKSIKILNETGLSATQVIPNPETTNQQFDMNKWSYRYEKKARTKQTYAS